MRRVQAERYGFPISDKPLGFQPWSRAPQGTAIAEANGVLQWTPRAAGKLMIADSDSDSVSANAPRGSSKNTKRFMATVEPALQEIPPPLMAAD